MDTESKPETHFGKWIGSTLVAFAAGFGLFPLIQNAMGNEWVLRGSYVLSNDLHGTYLHREEVKDQYIPRDQCTPLSSGDYVLKSQVQRDYLPRDVVMSDFVTRTLVERDYVTKVALADTYMPREECPALEHATPETVSVGGSMRDPVTGAVLGVNRVDGYDRASGSLSLPGQQSLPFEDAPAGTAWTFEYRGQPYRLTLTMVSRRNGNFAAVIRRDE